MNGMNKAIVGVVFGIALLTSLLVMILSLIGLFSTGDVTISYELDGPLGAVVGVVNSVLAVYDSILSAITDSLGMDAQVSEYLKFAFVTLGFVVTVLGMVSKPSLDVQGRDNPAQYLWTHRPKAFVRGLFAPFGLIPACYAKSKALVIIPVVLLVFSWPWALAAVIGMVVPLALIKAVVGMRISSASKKESREYTSTTQYAVCPKCKRNFLRPNVRCSCGLNLEYPVPNIYGIKYHTCNKGHNIPCMSGKRSDLRTVCPYCESDIETREAMPISISMVGAVGSGKTTLMLGAVKSITQVARTRDISVETITPGLSKDAILAKDVAPKTASGELDSECMFIRSRTVRDREIIFHDISGQEFEPKEGKILFEEYFTYTDGIVFAFDPMALTRERKGSTPMDVFESFHYMFTQINGTSPNKVSNVPLAIVATRADLGDGLSDGKVREFLVRNGQEGFVKVAESLFSNVRYFSVSSTGEDCMSAARPIWWIVSESDPELASAVPIN